MKPVKVISENEFNALGMRKAQYLLYLHMEQCSKEDRSISVETVYKIYFGTVRNGNAHYIEGHVQDNWRRLYKGHAELNELLKLKNKDAWKFLSKTKDFPWLLRGDLPTVKQWMKGNIGSLVMRGLLDVIPKLDTALLEGHR